MITVISHNCTSPYLEESADPVRWAALKAEHCPSCPLNLACLTGKIIARQWCNTCHGYISDAFDGIIRCSGVHAARPRYFTSRSHTVTGRLHDNGVFSCSACHAYTGRYQNRLVGFVVPRDPILKALGLYQD